MNTSGFKFDFEKWMEGILARDNFFEQHGHIVKVTDNNKKQNHELKILGYFYCISDSINI